MKKYIIVVYSDPKSIETFRAETHLEADQILDREREKLNTREIFVTEILRTFKR